MAHTAVRRFLWRQDIGTRTWIDPSALIDRTWPRGVHIGRDCIIAEEAVLLSHDFTRGLYLDTRIGDRCVLGARSIVLPGIVVGDDCIVHPGAVVVRDVPSGSVVIGNPATVATR